MLVFTLDEELNLPACLDSLAWSDDVIVVDSFSTDATATICRDRGVRFVQHAFTGFGDQRNWALEQAGTRHEWVLILDADERVPAGLADELGEIARAAPAGVAAFRVRRRFHLWGRWLRYSSLYPTWVIRLVRRGRVRYVNRGHAETQVVDGDTGDLRHDLIDENRKGVEAWLERQVRYSAQDARFELEQERGGRAWQGLASGDPMARRAALKRVAARLPARGVLYFLYAYVLRLGFLDGAAGFRFCRMRAGYQSQVAARKRELRRQAEHPGRRHP